MNIHDGTEGVYREIDDEPWVLYTDRRGNIRKSPYSPMTWRIRNAPPKTFPKTIILQVAYDADRRLAEIHGFKRKEWLSLHPEEKRRWLDEEVDFMEERPELADIRRGLFNAIIRELEPLWKEV